MRVLVCGGRMFDNEQLVFDALRRFEECVGHISTLIHGGANGADLIADKWARFNPNIKLIVFPANWKSHGNAAGPIRNMKMLNEGKPDVVIAFAGGKGTGNMVSISEARGIPIWRVIDSWPPDELFDYGRKVG